MHTERRLPPKFLNKLDLENYYRVDLEYAHVMISLRELSKHKSLTFSEELIQAWYKDFLRFGWTKQFFDNKCRAMLKVKTFGDRMDIADWFETSELFTQEEVNLKVKKQIDEKIRLGEMIFKNYQTFDPKFDIDVEAVKLYAFKQVERELQIEQNRFIDKMIEGERADLHQKEFMKRKRLKKLSNEKRKMIIEELIKTNKLDPRIDIDLAIKNIHLFSISITEYDIIKALQSV